VRACAEELLKQKRVRKMRVHKLKKRLEQMESEAIALTHGAHSRVAPERD
jgi:hypothetical protein